MKKTYFAPEISQTSVEIESLLQNLSNQGNGNWTQGGVGEGDDNDTEDDGRAKSFSIWDE
jgi:hypothetical protein